MSAPNSGLGSSSINGGSPNHAETNLLAALITSVPITDTSQGVIYMLVDNQLSVIARNNAFQDGELKEDIPGSLYDELLGS